MSVLTARELSGMFNVKVHVIIEFLHQFYFMQNNPENNLKHMVCFTKDGISLIDSEINLYKFSKMSGLTPIAIYVQKTRRGLKYTKMYSKDLALYFDIPEEYIKEQLNLYKKRYIVKTSLSLHDFTRFAGFVSPYKHIYDCIDDINIAQIIREKDKHRNKQNSKDLHYRFSKDFDKTRRFIAKQLVNQVVQKIH